jgi:hypothetical protein
LDGFVDALTNAMLVGDYLANLPGCPREGVLEVLGALDLAIHYAITGGEP